MDLEFLKNGYSYDDEYDWQRLSLFSSQSTTTTSLNTGIEIQKVIDDVVSTQSENTQQSRNDNDKMILYGKWFVIKILLIKFYYGFLQEITIVDSNKSRG